MEVPVVPKAEARMYLRSGMRKRRGFGEAIREVVQQLKEAEERKLEDHMRRS